MRLRAVIFLVAVTALASYSLGRQDAPTHSSAAASIAQKPLLPSKPIALVTAPPSETITPGPPKAATTAQADERPSPGRAPSDKSVRPEIKRNVEIALTAAAIAAILIKVSREQYYATGHPCACPDDLMRNGRACGARSAYSRPGGAAPKCYPSDITEGMISDYRRTASR
jgi:hypothetical protein